MQATRSEPSSTLLAGALEHLLNHLLRGCDHSARRAGLLLARLADDPATDAELRLACQRMLERLDAS